VSDQNRRDKDKFAACEKAGITLVQIPFWWDRTEASLRATLSKHCPQYIKAMEDSNAEEIPKTNPFDTSQHIAAWRRKYKNKMIQKPEKPKGKHRISKNSLN
jgi:hypothetical protein